MEVLFADLPSERIEGNIPRDLKIEPGNTYLFISKDQRAYTHGLHKYPAKFFPELPRWIIERFSRKGAYVLDPFMGSGTTNVEALLLQRRSVGIDIDPFSRFLARVKTTPLEKYDLLYSYTGLMEHVKQFSPFRLMEGIPNFAYRDHWFKPYVLQELAYLKSGISTLSTSPQIRNFFLVCFSSIIRQVSEADNNCTRTVIRKKLLKKVPERYALALFAKRMTYCVTTMQSFLDVLPSNTHVDIPNDMDARNMSLYLDNSFDLAVTSPPYLNAVDYPRTHQLEMYWLGFAKGSLGEIKKQHVGTEVVMARDYKYLHRTGISAADQVIKSIYTSDPRRAYIAFKFIEDMRSNLKEVYRVLKPGGRYVIVIGNNVIRGMLFENWKYLRELALQIGYSVETYFASAIINHFIKVPRKERIDKDYVLVLRK